MNSSARAGSKTIRGSVALGLIVSLGIGLSACGGSARSTPNFFTAKFSQGTLSGDYNPTGFTTTEVQEHLQESCVDGKLSSYAETPASGLVAFTAVCQGGTTLPNGYAQFERRANKRVMVEQIGYDDKGSLIFLPPKAPQ